MVSLVPKKGQVILEMANLLCGPDSLNRPGGMSSSPIGTPNGSRTRNTLLSEYVKLLSLPCIDVECNGGGGGGSGGELRVHLSMYNGFSPSIPQGYIPMIV